MSEDARTTPLYSRHVELRANMAPFAGYHMPLWYSSAKNEHLAVLTAAGLFDTSHMAVVLVQGSGAMDLLQLTFSRDLRSCVGQGKPITPGRCVYGVFLTPSGHVIDDAIITLLEADLYMVVVNAGMGPAIAGHLREHAQPEQVTVSDLTDQVGKIDLQGPAAGTILCTLLQDPDTVFTHFPYFSCQGHIQAQKSGVRLTDGTPLLLARSGYTGEFGFEIFVQPDKLPHVWDMILEAGRTRGLLPCGLAARDSLRAGAVLPLSHQDIGDWPFVNTPWDFALPWNSDQKTFSKQFIGAEALLSISNPAQTLAYVGRDLRKAAAGPESTVLGPDDARIGRILTCVTDVGIGWHQGRVFSVTSPDAPADFRPKGLCCGFIRVDAPIATGETIRLQDKRRTLEVLVVTDIRPHRTARKPLSEMLGHPPCASGSTNREEDAS